MCAPSMKVTTVLTELLEFSPVSLVDDIINTVNDVMYKCTEAMETYLQQRSRIAGCDYTEEIKIGTAKLETMLENAVDKNLDRLELYVLRNVLNIPSGLVDEGRFVLSHYENVKLGLGLERSEELFSHKLIEVEKAFQVSELLISRIKETRGCLERTKKFKKQLLEFLEGQGDEQIKSIVGSVGPVSETLKMLTTQLRTLYIENEEYCSSQRISTLLKKYKELRDYGVTRTSYIDYRSKNVVDSMFGEECEESSVIMEEDLKVQCIPTDQELQHPDWSAIQRFT